MILFLIVAFLAGVLSWIRPTVYHRLYVGLWWILAGTFASFVGVMAAINAHDTAAGLAFSPLGAFALVGVLWVILAFSVGDWTLFFGRAIWRRWRKHHPRWAPGPPDIEDWDSSMEWPDPAPVRRQ